MKEIIAEYPLVLTESSNNLSIFRFPVKLRNLKFTGIYRKPTSGYTEIPVLFPENNISMLKVKAINSNNITYRALPSVTKNYYHAVRISDKIVLQRLDSIYLFEPCHQYYPVEKMKEFLHRAESRDELERRRNSLVHKLRHIEGEEFKMYAYENCMNLTRSLEEFIPVAPPPHPKQQLAPATLKSISSCVFRTRIVNFQKLVELFNDSVAVGSVLARMTEPLCGRFILKNSYYEKRLWEPRSKLIELFRTNGRIPANSILFLKDEVWMLKELAFQQGKEYLLKGYRENAKFDAELIKGQHLEAINNVLQRETMASIASISTQTGIDSDLLEEMLSSDQYLHLSNNCYTLNDSSLKSSILGLFLTTKAAEAASIHEVLENFNQNENSASDILRKYCSRRGEKYYLKNTTT